jgi:hypothetical protein
VKHESNGFTPALSLHLKGGKIMHIGLMSTPDLKSRWAKLHLKIEVQRSGYTA